MARSPRRTPSAFVYTRLSLAPDGSTVAVARQEADARKLAKKLGLDVTRVFVDNDTSAYKRRRVVQTDGSIRYRNVRPAFAEMVDALWAGGATSVIAYDADRLWRDPRDLEEMIDLAEHKGIEVHSVTSGSLNLNTGDGRAMARVVAAMARKSSEDTSRRVARAHEDAAAQGKWSGGRRPFGYQIERQAGVKGSAKLVIYEPEAEYLRESARRILQGDTIASVVRWLDENIPPARGGKWHPRSLKQQLTSPLTAGLKVHRGVVVGDAEWPAILDRATWDAIKELLAGRVNPGRTAYLLSGLAVCGSCGEPMYGYVHKDGKARYRCFNKRTGGRSGCPKQVNRLAAPIDEFVLASVSAALEGLPSKGRARPDDKTQTAINDAETRLKTAQKAYSAGTLAPEDFFAVAGELRDKLKLLRAAQAQATRVSTAASASLGKPLADLPIARQRAVLREALTAVRLMPVGQGSRRFDPKSVDIV